MKKWTLIEQALTPEGKRLALYEHDGDYSIRVENVTLMSTRQHGSEERLAELACERMQSRRGARVLIGGLGFGFTLRAALKRVTADTEITVAEIMGAVIRWNLDPGLPLAARTMADPRVRVLHQDVADIISTARAAFDCIILDVDNGPAGLTTEQNAGLYSLAGLQAVAQALRPAGCVAFWSATPDPAFEKSMARAGFAVGVHRSRSHGNSGRHHTVFLGQVPA